LKIFFELILCRNKDSIHHIVIRNYEKETKPRDQHIIPLEFLFSVKKNEKKDKERKRKIERMPKK